MSEIDFLLRRHILDGAKYDKLIPKSKCYVTALGEGMTDFSVNKMAEEVYINEYQMQKVAPLLERSSLKDTCYTIGEWCYNHFQYKADKEDQLLRSPACSWAQRYDGIDCKSYSIVASAILANLGIAHYLRRVKQPAMQPDMWTHVYVVVPIDQSTASLAKGYYVIDGTVAPDEPETTFTEKSDLYMSMEHYALRAPQPQGLNGGLSIDGITGLFKGGFSLSSLSCIGSIYSKGSLDITLGLVTPWFLQQFAAMNQAVQSNSPTVLELVNKVLQNAGQIKDHAEATAKHDWSGCSQKVANGYRDMGKYYNDMVDKAFLGWLQTYFDVTYGTKTIMNNTFEPETNKNGNKEGKDGFKKNQFNRNCTVKTVTGLTLKKTPNMEIKAFEVNAFVADPKNYGTSGFNVIEAFKGVTTILAAFNTTPTANTTIPAGGGPTTGSGGKTGELEDIDGNPKTAGGGVVAAVLVCAGAGLLLFGGPKVKAEGGTAKPKATTKAKTTRKPTKA